MASPTINTKNAFISAPYLKRTASLLKGAATEYIEDVMPVSTSTISGMRDTIKPFASSVVSSSSNIVNKVKELNVQQSMRRINAWFLGQGNDYNDSSNDSDLTFDISVDSPEEAIIAQLTSEERSANQISKTVIETSHRMVESQIAATANILTSMDKVGAVVASGFDNLNNTLNKLLEITAKNTSALITATVGSSLGSSDGVHGYDLLRSGKFNLSAYKKSISSNISNSELGMLGAIIPMFTGNMGKEFFSSDNMANMGFAALTNKLAPNLKKNMKALDESINGIILNSLIRLGDQRNSRNLTGMLGKIFGINSDINSISTQRAKLEFKSIPFDTVTKEAITGAIPGYLRDILIQLGGPDQIYDHRSRSFRTKRSITKEFKNETRSYKSSLDEASSRVKSTLMGNGDNDVNYSNLRNMVHELIMEDMSESSYDRKSVSNILGNKNSAKQYIYGLLKNTGIKKGDGRAINQLANAYSSLDSRGFYELRDQAIRASIERNISINEYMAEAEMFNKDLSHITNSKTDRKNDIVNRYMGGRSSTISNKGGSLTPIGGTDYTNAALYEIYRRLNTGINVYQVGSSDSKKSKYKWIGKLPQPQSYRASSGEMDDSYDNNRPMISSLSGHRDHINILTDDTQIDANGNPIGGGMRFGKWASSSGKNFINSLFNGSPEDVSSAFNQIVSDLGDAAARPVKTFLVGDPSRDKQGIFSKINNSFGNITGYLQHQFMGTGYDYTVDGKQVHVKPNEKGGIVGYIKDRTTSIFTGSSDKLKGWTSEVSKYFDYNDNGDGTGSKKKAIMSASIGAMTGLGFLGGPIGMITGAMAGIALDSSGYGKKIKEKLFGHDDLDEDGKRTGKRSLGIIEKATNSIIDPFRYQLGKTFNAAGEVLKKNILGPLSDIGYAIKERMSDAAGGVVSKTFNAIFKGAGNLFKSALSIPMTLFGLPNAITGNVTRAGIRTGGSIVGSTLDTIANIAGGRRAAEGLSERRASRRNEIKSQRDENEYYKGGLFGSYKEWKSAQDERRSRTNLSDYIHRDESVIESSINTEKNTAEIADDIKILTHHATHHDPITNSSIYTSDKGLFNRVGEMFDFFKGRFGDKGMSSTSINSSNDSILSAAVGIAAQNGLTNDDVEDISSIADEATNGNGNKQSLMSRFKSMLKRNASDDIVEGGGGRGSSTLSKITKGVSTFISDLLPSWMLPLGGLLLSVINPSIKKLLWGGDGEEGIIPKIGSSLFGLFTNGAKSLLDNDNDGSVSGLEINKGINNINSGLSNITSPIGSIKIGGVGLTGSADPVGLLSSYRNARTAVGATKATFNTYRATKGATSAVSGMVSGQTLITGARSIRNTAGLVKEFGISSGLELAGLSNKAANAGKVATGLKGAIKWIGPALSIMLDSILMLWQGSEVFGDKYGNTLMQNVALVIGGALNGTGSGLADGFQWADILDVAANAMKWATIGAAAGSVVPILGNGVGAVLGFILGMILGMWGGKTLARDIGLLLDRSNGELSGSNNGSGSNNKGYGIASKAWNGIKGIGSSIANAINGFTGKAKDIFNLIRRTKWNSVESLLSMIIEISDIVGSGYGKSVPVVRSYRGSGGNSQYYQGSYGSALNMNASGCGPIAASYMANAYGANISPMSAANMLNYGGYRDSLGGTTSSGISAINNHLGIPARTGPVDMGIIGNKLANNEPVVFLGKSNDPNSPYTDSGHFVVGEGIDSSGNVTIMDPLQPIKKKYKIQNILNGIQETTYVDGDVGFGVSGESSISSGNPLNKQFVITSPFGDNSSFRRGISHRGIDIVPADGTKKAEVGAVYGGTITRVKSNLPDSHTGLSVVNQTSGNYVEYKTDDGIIVNNMHLKANSIPSNIRPGYVIRPGDRLGEMGSTGMSSGPHLHYEFRTSDGKLINPTNAVSHGATLSGFNASSNPYTSDGEGQLNTLSSVFDSVTSSFKNIFGLDNPTSSAESSFNTSGYITDDAASSILFSKIQNLDTSYSDYPGREYLTARTLNFILKVAPGVQATMDCGVLPSIRIAQAIIESGWGESSLTIEANNLFGMRAFSGWTGKRVTKRTGEWGANTGKYNITADFRAYNSWNDSIADQAENYKRVSNYKNAGLIGETDYKNAAKKLQKSGYATDPKYAQTLISMISQYDLIYFDHPRSKSTNSSITPSVYNNPIISPVDSTRPAVGPVSPISASYNRLDTGIKTNNITRFEPNMRGTYGMGVGAGDIDSLMRNGTSEYRRELSSLRSNQNLKNVGKGSNKSINRFNKISGYGTRHPGSMGHGILDDILDYNQTSSPISMEGNYGNSNYSAKLEQLLADALVELKSINTNTGNSSSRLLELAKTTGTEDIVPQKIQSKRSAPTPLLNNTNISSIMSIIRPV